jgi:phage terminase large subunit-like protein
VNSGERIDHGFLHVEYSIPDSVTESEIDSDIDRYGKMANPSWGHIVKPAEFRDDWNRSKGKPRELARCLQYRFNRWVGSTNRWLSANGWSAGARNFTLADFAGRECYLAIDLSRTRDSTSAVFMFPGDDEWIDLFPMFWMPEQTARDRDMLFPYMSWAKTGDLRLTPGGVVSYSSVKADIRAAVRDHGLRVISTYFDPHYAEELTQQLIDGESIRGESEDGIGGERVAFPQTLMAFTGPAKEFERRVSAGLVRHPNNLVMNWQIGHCEVMTDTNQNIRPVKPNPNSGKSVDGVVAGVMTFADVQSVESSDSESISPLQVL